jgi:hypothetical protein
MNTQAQQIAIAEACGWKKEIFLPVSDCSEAELILGYDEITEIWKSPNGQYVRDAFFPDYLNDLNAMREVVASHLKDQDFYLRWTEILDAMDPETKGWGTTASQQAEAFLRAKNIWIE